jgi:hypothetical protein
MEITPTLVAETTQQTRNFRSVATICGFNVRIFSGILGTI